MIQMLKFYDLHGLKATYFDLFSEEYPVVKREQVKMRDWFKFSQAS